MGWWSDYPMSLAILAQYGEKVYASFTARYISFLVLSMVFTSLESNIFYISYLMFDIF